MKKFPKLQNEVMLKRLEPPLGIASIVLDTDTYNEIDDQFAVVYAMLSEQIKVEAIYAAPFFNSRSSGPGDGMEKSYSEIMKLLEKLKIRRDNFVFHGSNRYLSDPDEPIQSEAVEDLLKRAMNKKGDPLYVIAIGAITNIASAIIMEPRIIERIIVVWLGGQPYYWHTAREFNLEQDLIASQILFNSGVPLIHIPTKNVSEHVRTTVPEMERFVKGQGAIGDYLYEIFYNYHSNHYAWSKVIWDITAIAYMINPDWVPSIICNSPILTNDLTWSFSPLRHFVRVAIDADRDEIFGDLFRKLERNGKVNK
ncbi:MAG: nucleoside hydrolase [bacterium]